MEVGKGIQVTVAVVGKEDGSHQVNKTKTKVSVFLLAKDAYLLRGRKHTGRKSLSFISRGNNI